VYLAVDVYFSCDSVTNPSFSALTLLVGSFDP